MDAKQVKQLQEEIIKVGREAYQQALIEARGGNLRVRLNGAEI